MKPHTPDTMTPKEIVANFANALKQFKPIDDQPSDTEITRIREVVAPLLLQIPCNETGVTHNLIGIIWPVAVDTKHYGMVFAEPTRFDAYDATIGDNATSVVRARTEAAHKVKRTDCSTYETAWQETVQFILATVKYTWVREI